MTIVSMDKIELKLKIDIFKLAQFYVVLLESTKLYVKIFRLVGESRWQH